MKKTLIAIFEDDKVDAFIYERLISHIKKPVEFHLFDNPDKGLDMAKKVKFDIIIIQIHFWGDNMSGINILKKIKEIYTEDIIAIAMTSLLQKGDLELLLSSGFSMCIEKPLVFQEINKILNESQN